MAESTKTLHLSYHRLLARVRSLAPLGPVLLLLLLFYVYPLLRTLFLSFNGWDFSLANYQLFFETTVYVRVLGFTLVMSSVVALACIVIGYPVAYVVATIRPRYRYLLIWLVMVPWLTNELVRNYVWLVILSPNGLVNQVLIRIGVIEQSLRLSGTMWAVLIGMIYVQLPLSILPLYAVMRGIDMDLLRVASSLGAKPSAVVRSILIPMTLPGIVAAGLLTFLTSLGFYITPAILGGQRDLFIANLIDIEVSRLVHWEFGSALALLLVVSALAILGLASRFTSLEGMTGRGGKL